MSKIWFFLTVASVFVLTLTQPQNVLPTMLTASASVITLCVEFCAIYAVWLGLVEILEQSGLAGKISNALGPFVKKVFKTNNPQAIKQISISISANMLGLGNVATPSGIQAIKHLDNKQKNMPYSMLMFTIFSTCSIQLLPTTIIALRTNAGSKTASDIVLPTLIVSFVSLVLALTLVVLFSKLFKQKQKEKTNKNKKFCKTTTRSKNLT